MRAREWKKAIEDEMDRLEQAALAEEVHGQQQLKLSMEKAKGYRATAQSLERILKADQGNDDDDDDDDLEKAKARLSPENELVGEGDNAF